MNALKFSKIKKKNFKLREFLSRIKEREFKLNKNFENTPWIHFNNKLFHFYRVKLKEKIIGVVVIIKFKNQDHLQFLYIEKNSRSKGVGKLIIDKLLDKKRFTTVHVYKNLSKRLIKFYENTGFKLSNLRESHSLLKNWIKRCEQFDNQTFIEKKLLYWNN